LEHHRIIYSAKSDDDPQQSQLIPPTKALETKKTKKTPTHPMLTIDRFKNGRRKKHGTNTP